MSSTPVDARHKIRRPKGVMATRATNTTKITRFAVCLLVGSLLICLLAPEVVQETEAKKLKLKEKKAIKSLVKGLIFKNLSTRKNFLPLPVPIPVPIEINEPPVYLKGKPKYVNIYKPAPTKAPTPPPTPIIKPTTYLHMPVYSPTYEYMMDPSGMYGSMYLPGSMTAGGDSGGGYGAVATGGAESLYGDLSGGVGGNLKGGGLTGASSTDGSFTDYDDEFGNYYMRKAASSPAGSAASLTGGQPMGSSHLPLYVAGRSLQHQMSNGGASLIDISSLGAGAGTSDVYSNGMVARTSARSDHQQQQVQQQQQKTPVEGSDESPERRSDSLMSSQASEVHEKRLHDKTDKRREVLLMSIDSEESVDHDNNGLKSHARVKRQISYSSNYEGPCEGFPLEVNIKSRLKLDSLFPIHGRSQLKKCLKKHPILPPVEDDHYPHYQPPPY